MTNPRLRTAGAAGALSVAVAVTGPGAAWAASPATANPPATKASSLAAARMMLDQAKQDVVEARALLRTVEAEIADGGITAHTYQELTGETVVSESQLEIITRLANADGQGPDAALVEELQALWTGRPFEDGSTAPAPQEPLRAANKKVQDSLEQRTAAARLIQQMNHVDSLDGPGARELARMCARAGVVVDVCVPPKWSEINQLFDTVMIGRYVNANYPAIDTVGGWRPYDAYPDHPSGRAADVMMPHGGAGADVQLGNAIARYFQHHADEFGIQYMIWRQRMWKAGTPIDAWVGMSDRGSPTANHMDHVHITVTDGHSGGAFKQLLLEARRAAS